MQANYARVYLKPGVRKPHAERRIVIRVRKLSVSVSMYGHYAVKIDLKLDSLSFLTFSRLAKSNNFVVGLKVFTRGGHLGIFWVGMCHPGLQIGTPF